MVKSKTIKFNKIPLKNSQTDIHQSFRPVKTLYLELLEDKSKIIQNLVNKDHVQQNIIKPVPKFEDDNKQIEMLTKDDIKSDIAEKSDTSSAKENVENSDIAEKSDTSSVKENVENSDIDSEDDEERQLKQRLKQLINDTNNEDINEEVKSNNSNDLSQKDEETSQKDDDNDSIAIRLKQLLNDDDDNDTVIDFMKSQDKYKQERNISGQSLKNNLEPPSLSELENNGVYERKQEIPDLSSYDYNTEDDENAKREMLFKFELLKKSYPTGEIPEVSVHSSLVSMQKLYDITLRKLSLDSSVESYKTYLIGCFMATEFVFGNFLNFDMQGFTNNKYFQ